MNKNSFDYKTYRILNKEEMAPDISLFRIEGRLDFAPGQFAQVALPHFGEATFAPCSDPSANDSFELCIRGCGSTSSALIQLLPGDEISLRGPYGHGWPIEAMGGYDVILIAGGLGLVPLRPLISQFLQKKTRLRSLTLLAGFKSSDHLLFEKDLLDWKKRIKVIAACEYASRDFWGEKGLITESLATLHLKAKKTIALICGPEIMYAPCLKALAQKGIPDNQIFVSLERRMECGIGACQHCNVGRYLVCQDGPVFRWDLVRKEIEV